MEKIGLMVTVFRGLTILMVLICASLMEPQSSFASIILQDDFNSENGGNGAGNYYGFANWTVSEGSVDLIGNGFFDFYPGNGLYVDLDGDTYQPGLMESDITFGPGTYLLSFDLGGSQRGDINTVTVMMGNYSEAFDRSSSDPLALVTRTISITTSGKLSFQNAGGVGSDNMGAILDNVTVSTPIPEPSTVLLLCVGLVGVGLMRRKFKK